AEPDGADHQGESDAGVQPVPDQEVVRVALVEFGAVAGRRVDQQGAEQRQDERRQQYRPVEAPDQGVAGEDAGPSAPLGSVSGDLEAVHDAGHRADLRCAWPPRGRRGAVARGGAPRCGVPAGDRPSAGRPASEQPSPPGPSAPGPSPPGPCARRPRPRRAFLRRVSRLAGGGVLTVPSCCPSSGACPPSGVPSPSWAASWAAFSSFTGSLAIFGEAMVPSVRMAGSFFFGVGSSAFFLSISPSGETPYSAL